MHEHEYDEHQQLIIKQSRYYSFLLVLVLFVVFSLFEKAFGPLFTNPIYLLIFPCLIAMSFYVIRNTKKDAFLPLDGFQDDFSIYYLLIGIELFCSIIPLLLFLNDLSAILADIHLLFDSLFSIYLCISLAIEALVMWWKLHSYKKR